MYHSGLEPCCPCIYIVRFILQVQNGASVLVTAGTCLGGAGNWLNKTFVQWFGSLSPRCCEFNAALGCSHPPTPGKIVVQDLTQSALPESVRSGLRRALLGWFSVSSSALPGTALIPAATSAKREWGTPGQVLLRDHLLLLCHLSIFTGK